MSRYAIYALPSAPRAAAEEWLARGDVQSITVDARRYGYHATLKAPFRLATGRTEDELTEAVADFLDGREAVVIPELTLKQIDGFFALVPGHACEHVDGFAADVVHGLDDFRAPLSEADVERRRPESLTARQRQHLHDWGYPYVLDEFRFHITLTDRLDDATAALIRPRLEAAFVSILGSDVALDQLAVFVEPEPGAPFAIHSIHPITLKVAHA